MKKVSNNILKKLIDKHDVISFDIFDTLIKRNCLKPSDIFKICEVKYNSKKSKKISDFKNIRVNAEIKCRSNSNDEEITLEEIYDNIVCENLDKKEMMSIEINCELDYCVANLRFKEIYDYCIKNNKRVLFVSDMYLDEKTILKILEKNGYKTGRLYLSSKYRATKHSGNLYKIVLKNEKIKPSKMLHIGDSKRADFFSPTLCGIISYKINRSVKNTSYISVMDDNLNNNILYSFINNKVYNMNQYERIGYELLGPICYSFCNHLHKVSKEKNINKLFFCSRDMKFIHEAYNYIYNDEAIYNKYFYVSRKSLRLPYFHMNNDFDSFFLMIPDKKMNMKSILGNFNLAIDDKIIEKYGFASEEYNCYSLKDNKKFIKFYNEIVKKEIITNKEIKEQYDNFIKYLNIIGFDRNSAIVDLGWKGTTQYSMNKILKYNTYGIYFGLEKNSFKELDNHSSTFIFNRNDDGVIEDKIYSFRSLFEIMFASQDGSTLKYKSNSSEPYVLGKPDNYDNSILKDIQTSAIKFIKDFSKYNVSLDDTNKILNNFMRIGINPTYEESIIFGNLNFDNMIDGYLAKPDKLIKYVINPLKLKKDIFLSEWKIGFMKRLFKINLPYYRVYNKLKKYKKGGNK